MVRREREGLVVGRKLARTVAALPDGRMRLTSLAGRLKELGRLRGVWALEALIRGAMLGDADCMVCYSSLLDPESFVGAMPADLLDGMIESGDSEGCRVAVQWLRGLGLREQDAPIDVDRLVAKELQEMSLGERRALARRAGHDTLHAVACDPNAGVIANLLNNPRTNETHVLRVCSRRPTVSPPLVAVLRAPRWINRYKVKRSLVKNPYLELRYALCLLVCLNRTDLREVREDETLSVTLRRAADSLLALHNADLNLC